MAYDKTVTPPWKIYEEELYSKGYGIPLWVPEPHNDGQEVQIGDVGYINDGQFVPMFNVCSGERYNEWNLPDGFQKFSPRDQLKQSMPSIQAGKIVFSAGVQILDASADISG